MIASAISHDADRVFKQESVIVTKAHPHVKPIYSHVASKVFVFYNLMRPDPHSVLNYSWSEHVRFMQASPPKFISIKLHEE